MWRLKLRETRKSSGLSIKRLAEEARVPISVISDSENDKTSPTLDTLNRLANVLGPKILEWSDGR